MWVGCGALGERDGRVALYRRERVPLLLEPAEPPADLGAARRARCSRISSGAARASSASSCGGVRRRDRAATCSTRSGTSSGRGLVTNDTFAPLRALGRAAHAAAARAERAHDAQIAARPLRARRASSSAARAEPTERAHARALVLLERYGVVTREVAELEELPGGFAAVYRGAAPMEELGKLRRGHFVEGLGGAQFAFPARSIGCARRQAAAGGRGRGARRRRSGESVRLAAALAGARRESSGAAAAAARRGRGVVLVDGEPALYLGLGGKHMLTFPAARQPAALAAAVDALRAVAEQRRGKFLRIEHIDGRPAQGSELAPQLLALQWKSAYRGLELEAR